MNKPLSVAQVLWVCGGIIAFIWFIGFLNSSSSNNSPLSPATIADPQSNGNLVESANTQVAATSSIPQFSDGNYIVGTDIQPGTYRTRQASQGCYFERLSGFDGETDDIIANEDAVGPAVVTILATDKGFDSSNCGTWTEDLSQITTSQTSFSDGTFIVGTDILPGTYRSSGEGGCYYERLSGFDGTTEDIIANQDTDSSAIITIAATDKGFASSNCGTWTIVSAPTTTATTKSNNVSAWSSYPATGFQTILDDPGHYIGDKVRVTGMVFDFLGAGGRGGDDNYVEIENPNNPNSAAARIMLQVDSDANYYTATQELNSVSNVSLSGNLPDSVIAYGIVRASASFSLTAGGFVSEPVIEVARIDQCNDMLPTCELGSTSIFPAGLNTPSTAETTDSEQTSQATTPAPSAPSDPRYFQLGATGVCQNDGNGTIMLTGYPYANGYEIPANDINSWSDGSVAFTVPASVASGTYQVSITGYEPGIGYCSTVNGGSIKVY